MASKNSSHAEIIAALLAENTPVRFRAGGVSMTPTILNSEQVSIRPLRPTDLRRGAILLYKNHNRLILHRLIHTRGALIFTGDAALSGSESIAHSEIIGVATEVDRTSRPLRLDTALARAIGMARYFARPTRRLIARIRNHFAPSP